MANHFHEELGALTDALVALATTAGSMIDDAVRMLMDRDPSVKEVLEGKEAEVNRLQCEVDDRCTTLIALHQPTASDLRLILGCVKTNTDLERIGDEAINLSHKAARLIAAEPLPQAEILGRMGAIASSMVAQSIRVFSSGTSLEARELIARDKELNALKKEVTKTMTELMCGSCGIAPRALDVILASRNIERVGDHVKNIAENAIFIREGKDVRHRYSDAAQGGD